MSSKIEYTCKGKGGRYEILGLATGAGLTRGEDRLIYKDASTGRLFLRTEDDFSDRMERLQTVAAPVVERQPVAVVHENMHGCKRAIFLQDGMRLEAETMLYTAPPELAELQALSVTNIMLDVVPGDGNGHEIYAKSVAEVECRLSKQGDYIEELQATIARLTADIERLARESERVNKSWHGMKRDLDNAKAEIERLKGGQGEPVAVVTSVISRKNKLFEIDILNNSSLTIGDKLYTSQPAPVSAVTAEQLVEALHAEENRFEAIEHSDPMGINECIDVIREAYKAAPVLRDGDILPGPFPPKGNSRLTFHKVSPIVLELAELLTECLKRINVNQNHEFCLKVAACIDKAKELNQ